MFSKYGDHKYFKKYIKKRYGNIRWLTLAKREEKIKQIVFDHSKLEIKRMLRAAQNSIDEDNNHQPFFLVPFTIITSMVTLISSVWINYTNNTVNNISQVSLKLFEKKIEKEIESSDINEIIESLSMYGPYQGNIKVLLWIFNIVLVGFFIYFFIRAWNSSYRYNVKALMEDCLDVYDEVKTKQILEIK
ncbi:hypothetical protein [Bacillus altitudinis]|uniref:hypothetical protein n=1 Tax=Bacillus altitudinis TaxID=293387 RepID=UPI00119DE9EB|nr:hypothetical protein [Bacillus altitudinis]